MRVWRVVRSAFAGDAFSGEGARRFGGRWNSPGIPVTYTSSSLALAALETFVNLEPNRQPRDLVSIAVDLPGDVSVDEVEVATLGRRQLSWPVDDNYLGRLRA